MELQPIQSAVMFAGTEQTQYEYPLLPAPESLQAQLQEERSDGSVHKLILNYCGVDLVTIALAEPVPAAARHISYSSQHSPCTSLCADHTESRRPVLAI